MAAETQRLRQLIPSLGQLIPAHRKLVAEIAMIRLCLLLENKIESVCCKILCGAVYIDGTAPKCLAKFRSRVAAENAVKTYGRAKPKRFPSWNKSREIRDNLLYTLDSTDPLFSEVRKHAGAFTEMRYVRNHIAHGNRGTRNDFHTVVVQHYGALRRGMTPGMLLLDSTVSATSNLERYIIWARVAVRDISRA